MVAEVKERERNQISTGWKDVTLKIFGSDEKIVLPVMVSSKVGDVKKLLAEMHGAVAPHQIELVFKSGPSYKRHRNGDEIQSTVVVKGIKSFVKGDFEWPHPFMVIGAGHMGLRQALKWQRDKKHSYTLFDKFERIGGNAWVSIANPTSKLQTEGPQYQLQYDVFDKNIHGLLEVQKYGYWPSREEICAHLREVCDEYGVTPNIKIHTEVTEMNKFESPDPDIRKTYYDWSWKCVKEGVDDEGVYRASCLTYYPGCLVVPHRKTWPGEDVFGGNIGYGFSREFDYVKVDKQDCIIIGMGAFAHENVRTLVEHGANKCYNIARHFNLMMPRMVCWWVNQSTCPPTAAMVLHAMEPCYAVCGHNPWNFFSVTANAERTVATIKQYTRWGISDIYILSMYFNKCETVTGEVKRFKERAAVLNTGRVIEDLDHIIKVIGFDGDFGVDKLMKTTTNFGPWPDGDWRRFTMSDQSAIDASRFTNIAISPAVSSMSFMTTFYFTHPECGYAAMSTGMLPENKSEPELGSPAYHYEPRKGTAAMMVVGSIHPELGKFENFNGAMKKASMHHIAGCKAYQQACERDWFKYCKLFKDQGCTHKWPAYPISIAGALNLCKLEEELAKQEELKWMTRMGISPEQAQMMKQAQEAAEQAKKEAEEKKGELVDAAPAAPPSAEEQAQIDLQMRLQQEQQQARDEMDFTMPQFMPGESVSFEPARKVLQARQRSSSPAKTDEDCKKWLKEGTETRDYLLRAVKRGSGPKAIGR